MCFEVNNARAVIGNDGWCLTHEKGSLIARVCMDSLFSLIVVAVIYFANSFIIPKLGLSQQDLLFLEGLLLVVLGSFFLVVEETHLGGRVWSARRIAVGTLSTMRSRLKPNTIRVAVVLVSTGALLIVISLL